MAITNFVPDIWARVLLDTLKNSHVYGAPGIANRNYEGEIRQAGDSVKITSITDPTVNAYTEHSDITVQALTDATQSLLVDQQDYVAWEVDDVERVQSAGDIMRQAMVQGAYALRDDADVYLAAQLEAGVDAGNVLTPVDIDTPAEAVQALIDLSVQLDESNVPSEGRWAIVPPSFHGLLLGSDLFVRADASGSTDALRNGRIGSAFGLMLYKSNNCPAADTGTGKKIFAGHPIAFSYAQQITTVEADRVEKRFADMVKALHVYGAKVTRPTGIAEIDTSAT